MLRMNVKLHSRYPGYEVKAVLSFTDLPRTSPEFRESLKALWDKLEQLVPQNLKVKYVAHTDGVTLTAKVEKEEDAQRVHYKIQECVKTAAQTLNYKLVA